MKTIRQQLTRKLLFVIGLLVVAGGTTVYLCTRTALIVQFDTALAAKAQALTTLTEEKKDRIEIEFSDEHMHTFDTGGHDLFELWQADGKLVERSPSLHGSQLRSHQDLSSQPTFWNLTLPDGQPGRAVGFAFIPENSEEESRKAVRAQAILLVASTRDTLDRTLATLLCVLAGGGVLLLTAIALFVPRILGRELLPLQQLAKEATQINATALSARFSVTGLPGELSPIAARLNELLARLEDSFQRERRFSSDVAHEFRTPVAELRSLAELALKLPDTRTANMDHDTLAIALHMESILTQLLTLARGERSDLLAQPERLLIGALVHVVCAKFQNKAAARQLELRCHASREAVVTTDPALLRSILSNLVDNAVEYAPSRSAISVELVVVETCFTLRVSNAVQDLETRDLPHLFERFWRKDTARTANGHSGLGLALAKTFAQAIGCELTAGFAESQHLTFTLTNAKN